MSTLGNAQTHLKRSVCSQYIVKDCILHCTSSAASVQQWRMTKKKQVCELWNSPLASFFYFLFFSMLHFRFLNTRPQHHLFSGEGARCLDGDIISYYCCCCDVNMGRIKRDKKRQTPRKRSSSFLDDRKLMIREAPPSKSTTRWTCTLGPRAHQQYNRSQSLVSLLPSPERIPPTFLLLQLIHRKMGKITMYNKSASEQQW
jgi:hypothetical protein